MPYNFAPNVLITPYSLHNLKGSQATRKKIYTFVCITKSSFTQHNFININLGGDGPQKRMQSV